MNESIQTFLAVCGGIVTISAAIAAIYKWIAPAIRVSKRIDLIEQRQKKDFDRLNEHEETNKLLCRAMLCLLDVAENDVGESPENLKRIQNTKADIQEYLIQR